MVIFVAIINILLSLIGLYRAYRNKHMIFFIWLILSYYSVTSIVSLMSPESLLFSMNVRMTYVINMLLCVIGFLLSDCVFNKKMIEPINMQMLTDSSLNQPFFIIEILFWISLFATFFELKVQDYNTYNTGSGAGWFQVIFQSTSCILIRFLRKKQWEKLGLASVVVLAIVSFVGVRSLMYFVVMPIGLFFIYENLLHAKSIRKALKYVLPMLLLAFLVVYVVNYLRFGESRLPETELTTISLTVMDNGIVMPQYIMSALHYMAGLLTPIINALNKLGFGIPDPSTFLFPSVPRLNAVVTQNVADVAYLENAAHMPGTIYHDLWYCWGKYAAVAAFFLYWFLFKISSLFQKNANIFFCFSSIFGWHFYMLMRGSVDTCSSGIAYSFFACIFLCYYLKKKSKKTAVSTKSEFLC